MKIFVTVKPGSKRKGVLKLDNAHFVVRFHTRPIEGQANKALVSILADHFHIPQNMISIVSGLRDKRKIIEIA